MARTQRAVLAVCTALPSACLLWMLLRMGVLESSLPALVNLPILGLAAGAAALTTHLPRALTLAAALLVTLVLAGALGPWWPMLAPLIVLALAGLLWLHQEAQPPRVVAEGPDAPVLRSLAEYRQEILALSVAPEQEPERAAVLAELQFTEARLAARRFEEARGYLRQPGVRAD